MNNGAIANASDIKDHPEIVTSLEKLREVSRPTTVQECQELDIWGKLKYILDTRKDAVGVAAIQIGYPIRALMCRFNTKDGKTVDAQFVNPVIVKRSVKEVPSHEGCLSFPGKAVNTVRNYEITLHDDLAGDQSFAGVPSIILQHEMDHLDGIVMMDRSCALTVHRATAKVGRNDPCPCGKKDAAGNPIKYKKCCGILAA